MVCENVKDKRDHGAVQVMRGKCVSWWTRTWMVGTGRETGSPAEVVKSMLWTTLGSRGPLRPARRLWWSFSG